jgi:Cd2+/Zn2+-exporting ATPase
MSLTDRPAPLQSLTMNDPSFVRRSLSFVGLEPKPRRKKDAERPSLLANAERILMASELTLSLASACLLVVAIGIRFLIPAERGLSDLVAGAAALLVAGPVFLEAWESIKEPSLDGVTERLVALALLAAWTTGDMMTAALLPIVMTIGHVLEERSMLGSDEAVKALGRLTQADARRIRADGSEELVPTTALREGDVIELRAGERLPADGVVRKGASSLDMASLTGESVPVDVREGESVLAGSMNIDGLLHIELTRVGEDTTLGRIIALMRDAEEAKPPVTRLLDRYANQYMVLVILVAAGTWFVTNNVPSALAVLVASCPCALVLAAPATSVAAIVVAARHGILIKGSAFLEHLADVTSVVFDKTGTITTGELQLAEARPVGGADEGLMRRLAASLGAASNHPLSQAAAGACPPADRLDLIEAREMGGFGVVGVYQGQEAALGRADLFERLNVAAPPPPAHEGPIAGVSLGSTFLGWLLFLDRLRPHAEEAVRELRSLGMERILLLTGDRDSVAQHVAAEVGIDEVSSGMLPQAKLARVREEIRLGYRPMVVGDGINDSLALRAGAVGVAMGAQGADVAMAAADLALMTNDLRRLATCIRLSRRCRRTIYVNVAIGLSFTFGLTALSSVGALGVEAPIIAAVLHNVSTFLGLGNAGRVMLFDETQPAAVRA